jgi:hypothetical protein
MQPEDIRRALHELSGQGGEPVGLPFGIAIIDESAASKPSVNQP